VTYQCTVRTSQGRRFGGSPGLSECPNGLFLDQAIRRIGNGVVVHSRRSDGWRDTEIRQVLSASN
jgi:hypothetical protein